jgi:hypothetical protein
MERVGKLVGAKRVVVPFEAVAQVPEPASGADTSLRRVFDEPIEAPYQDIGCGYTASRTPEIFGRRLNAWSRLGSELVGGKAQT